MEINSDNASLGRAVGALLACAVLGIGTLRNVPIVTLLIRAVVIGFVASQSIRLMHVLIQRTSPGQSE